MKDLVGTVMLGIIINRTVNSLPLPQKLQMLHQKLCLQGIRMVVIHSHTLLKRDSILSAVIIVVIKDYYVISKTLFNSVCKSRFTGAGAAGNSYNKDFPYSSPTCQDQILPA